MLTVPSTLALVFSFAMHTGSQGRSTFDLDAIGRVRVGIDISYVDARELCASATVLDDDTALFACLSRTIPDGVRIHALTGDRDKACAVRFDRFDKTPTSASDGTVHITAHADCDDDDFDQLLIDWGLFRNTQLDHVSVAKISQPHADSQLAMLSKRQSRAAVPIVHSHVVALLIALGAIVAVLCALGFLFVRKRLSAREQKRG